MKKTTDGSGYFVVVRVESVGEELEDESPYMFQEHCTSHRSLKKLDPDFVS